MLFHGLEGSSRSHYAEAFADFAAERGLAYVVPHFRGCSGELNQAPRAYHSGDHEEIGWILARLREQHGGPLVAVGVSLGGNALMRWAGEAGEEAAQAGQRRWRRSARRWTWPPAAVAIGRGFNRLVYTTMFLRSMKPKALRKLEQHPGLFDREPLLAARDLYEFDDVFTAPLHGFRNADDYYARASAKPHLHRIRIPALALNALQRPVRAGRQPAVAAEVGPHVTLWQPARRRPRWLSRRAPARPCEARCRRRWAAGCWSAVALARADQRQPDYRRGAASRRGVRTVTAWRDGAGTCSG